MLNQEINRQNFVRKIKDRYKPLFCAQEFYQTHQKLFAILATKIDSVETHKPDQIEKFIVTTLILSLLRRRENWFGGLRKNSLSPRDCKYDINIVHKTNFLTTTHMKYFTDAVGIKWSASLLPNLSVYEFINIVKIKSIPEKVFWSLNFLCLNKNQFLISNVAPTPYDLLSIQARGQRVITFEENFSIWDQLIYDHRDVLSFWLHDLVHAAEFYQNEDDKKYQISFYRWIELLNLKHSDENIFSAFLAEEKNRTRFEYLISDMNSHPLHLVKTFRAILDEADPAYWAFVIKKTESLILKDENNKSFSSNTLCLHSINSNDFDSSQYDALLHILSCINHIWALSNKPPN